MVNLRHHVVEEPYSNFNSDQRGNFKAGMEDHRPKLAPVASLSARINTVRHQLQVLRYQVQKEKRLLEEERNRMSNSNFSKFQNSDGTPTDYPTPLSAPPFSPKSDATQEHPRDRTQLTQPSKRHLEDIERQCDLELNKLQSYLSNIGELKTHWRSLMNKSRLGQFHSYDEVTQGIDGEFSDPRVGSKSENYFN